jgi:hypothetical protein
MSSTRADRSLQTIFSFFLGLMLTAFFGVGVYTFYPSPEEDLRPQIEAISHEAAQLRGERDNSQLTPDEIDTIEALEDERAVLQVELREAGGTWARRTSVALVVLATFTMAVSLLRAPPVVGNGLLLGGLFTMLYGVGWIIGSESSLQRFGVMTVALVVTLGLGYVRFVRGAGGPGPDADGGGDGAAGAGAGDEGLDRRLRDVEERLDRVADALGR